ncbi:MAG TPA: isoprenylcysteine carboxylmethyltransferase family protein [Myxococcales bacterium]|nr:isoprenylcysteine carboxylmethyltransferase family protein [Myxococcales bacterium]
MVTWYIFLLAGFGAERVAELVLSKRNARRAFARGAVESGAGHFRFMVAVHALFLPCCAVEVLALHRSVPGALGPVALALALAAQALRWWAIASLGDRWNVRVIAVPGETPVRRGPYRFARHPNYVAVVIEMLAVPLAHGAWLCAAVFSVLNAVLLRGRIRIEEQALGDGYQRAFAGVPRFVPHA